MCPFPHITQRAGCRWWIHLPSLHARKEGLQKDHSEGLACVPQFGVQGMNVWLPPGRAKSTRAEGEVGECGDHAGLACALALVHPRIPLEYFLWTDVGHKGRELV